MKIDVLLFDRFTALDAVGPYEVLSRIPGAELCFVAKETRLYRTDTKMLGIAADAPIADRPAPDILLIPGGPGTDVAEGDEEILAWIRRCHEETRWTTSVCTGSHLLGAAGLLDGLEATTYWADRERLRDFGATPVVRRVVRNGKILNAAGVSSGIDMALTLVALELGEAFAQAIQLGIEYDPAPPFDAGSPERAPVEVVEMVRGILERSARG